MRVAVLKGGPSLERGTSLRSAARVEGALARLGHETRPVEAGPDLVGRLSAERPDVAFVALRGAGGDGTVQELLEILGIPYTGSRAAACALCMDRALAKHELREAGVATPDWFSLHETAFRELGAADALGELEQRLGFPLVVRPSRAEPPFGPELATTWFDVPAALIAGFDFDERVLLERLAGGPSVGVAVLDGEPLPADGGANATAAAQSAYAALGCSGAAQVDLVLDEIDGPQVIAVDPIPDLGETGLVPRAAAAAGIPFDTLVARILAGG